MNKEEYIKEEKEIPVHNICGTYSENDIVWNVLKLEPGHSIIITAHDRNEYDTNSEGEKYAKVIRPKIYHWRPLSEDW